ncbi:MAG TPA: hypothetical protein VK077_06645 [Virgibacillus sp.]|nr:hypothetical protein [Virgibacillus sp.]
MTIVVAVAFEYLYLTEAGRQAIRETILNPARTAMVGQGYMG